MLRFYRSIQPSATFLLFAGLVLIQGCWGQSQTKEKTSSGDPDMRGVEREMDAIALRQIEDYRKTGKFSTITEAGKYCHKYYSQVASTNDAVTILAVDEPCLLHILLPMAAKDADEVEHYVSKLFVVPDGTSPNRKFVEVQCSPPSRYRSTTFDNRPLEPRLVRGRFPEFPTAEATGANEQRKSDSRT
jgi:hypothetical protein